MDKYPAPPSIQHRAHVRSMTEYRELYRQSLEDPDVFWAEQAKAIDWFHPWHQVFDADYDEVDFAWYSGGRLNACFNCVDRHLAHARASRPRSSGRQDEPGVYQHISYRELKHDVCRVANVLLRHGVEQAATASASTCR